MANFLILVVVVLLALLIIAIIKIDSLKDQLANKSSECDFTASVNETLSNQLTFVKKKAYVRQGRAFVKLS